MKKFEFPEFEIQAFAVEDVLTTSIEESKNPDQLPLG